MELVDAHAHLESDRFKGDLDEVVERAKKKGVCLIINSGVNPSTNRRALEISQKYDIVEASFGIYPIDAVANKVKDLGEEAVLRYVEKFDVDKELKWIEENANKCIAIGEVGLDYKILPGTEKLQREVFEKVIRLAKRIDKPLVIHSRKAESNAIDMLESSGINRILMHCFSGKKSLIKRCIDLGWFLSVPPVITRLDHFKMLVEMVPLDQIITETDAPYLSPIAGKRNEPSNVAVTIKEIARIKGLSKEVVADQIWKNTKKLFGL